MDSFKKMLVRLGGRIRELRKARRWSQEKLALEAEISRTYMGSIELGAKGPSLWTLHRISRALGVQLVHLFLPPTYEKPQAAEIVARLSAKLLDRRRTIGDLEKIEALVETVLK